MAVVMLKEEIESVNKDYRLLPLASLNVAFPGYQRPLTEGKIKSAIRKGVNLGGIGTLVVSQREDGSFWVLDGQHRAEMLRRIGEDKVVCEVRHNLSYEEEAEQFFFLNDGHTKPHPIEMFHARLLAGEEKALAITNIVRKYGLTISRSGGPGPTNIQGVIGINKIYDGGAQVLDDTLRIATSSWPGNSDALQEKMLAGISLFLLKHQGEVDQDRLVRILSRILPGQLMATARNRILSGGGIPQAIYEVMLAEYNKRLRGAGVLEVVTRRTMPRERRFSKLTHDQVQTIKGRLRAGEKQCDLARDYNVDQRTISGISTGNKWSWIE